MSVIDTITQDMKQAMKDRAKFKLNTLRMVKTAFQRHEIDKGPVDDAVAIDILLKLVKQRKDSISQFEKADRQDLADTERQEVEIIETYLPAAPSEDELKAAIEEAVSETGADSMKQMGQVMKFIKEKFAGRPVDGKALSQMVRTRLQS